MTEPRPSRPVPGPPLPGPAAERAQESRGPADGDAPTGAEPAPPGSAPFADLEQLPVADHVAVFEAEHSRLQDELSTIDQV
jgi:hypothetical protein